MQKIRICPPLSFALLLALILSACTKPALFTPGYTVTATPTCADQTAQVELSTPDTTITVGQPVTISVTLNNITCYPMGLLLYRLDADPEAVLGTIEPIDYPSGVAGGGSHTVELKITPVQAGEVSLSGGVSFEGTSPDGAFYWGAVGSETPLVLTVQAE